jgi:hypothetical protein
VTDADWQPIEHPDPPADVMVDLETGLAINIPLGMQESGFFWASEHGQQAKARIEGLRKQYGVVIDDDKIPAVPQNADGPIENALLRLRNKGKGNDGNSG